MTPFVLGVFAGIIIAWAFAGWRDMRWHRRHIPAVRDRLDCRNGFPRAVPDPPAWQVKRGA